MSLSLSMQEYIEASAPTRIDLAGGTLDIWPLYLFHPGAVTINAAIDLVARLRVSRSADRRFHVVDQDTGRHCAAATIEAMKRKTGFELFAWAMDHFGPEEALAIRYSCMAPQGAGLAGSSSLLAALCGVLNRITGRRYGLEGFPELLRDIETRVLGVPAGLQDYYPALWGGVQGLKWGAGAVQRVPIDLDARELERWLILVFTRTSRNSGTNNWRILKRHIDGDRRVLALLDDIVKAARRMEEALLRGDYERAGVEMGREAASRERLTPGILTPEIRRVKAIAGSAGALAVKVCGAGGGGCVVVYCDPDRRSSIAERLVGRGFEIVPFRIARSGLRVRRGPLR